MKVMKKIKKKNRGFSLIEVLLAIVILGLVAAPILQLFITSMNINNRSKKLMAATDVSAIIMETLSGMTVDTDTEGIRAVLTKADDSMRFESLSYEVEASDYGIAATDIHKFELDMWTSYRTGLGEEIVYSLEFPSSPGKFGVAMGDVKYNGYTFDVIIWFEPVNSSGKYHTYDVTVEVFDLVEVEVPPANPGEEPTTEIRHFETKLTSVEGAVANL